MPDGDISNNQIVAALRAALNPPEDPSVDGKKKKSKTFENIQAEITYGGTKITLPDVPYQMKPEEAITWLNRIMAADQEKIAVHETIDASPWDGAVAFMKALKEIYGWANPVPTPSFFGPQPPTMVAIDIGANEKATIFWGAFSVPGIEGQLTTDIQNVEGRPCFVIGGTVRRKNLEAVHEIAEMARKIVREESIYRGKAVRLLTNSKGNINYGEPPKYIDLSRINPAELVFSADLMEQVTTNLFTPIERTQDCRNNKIPLKRGVLLEGPFGTGKTLCASVTAQKCEANGWTFITVERVTALKSALQFAQLYQPAVVFVEDIDREMSGERSTAIDDILNTIDGVVSKGAEIMVVMTSNDAESITRALLRPGRLDAILHVDAPDADAAEKLMRIYGRELIPHDAPLTEAKTELGGQIPAVIRECVERAKLYAISQAEAGAPLVLRDSAIAGAARGMKHHLDLLNGKPAPEQTPSERLGEAMVEVLNHGLANGAPDGLSAAMRGIKEKVGEILEAVTDD